MSSRYAVAGIACGTGFLLLSGCGDAPDRGRTADAPPAAAAAGPATVSDSPDGLRFTAIHEAGHAVASSLLGVAFESVEIGRRAEDGRRVEGIRLASVAGERIATGGEAFARPYLVQFLAGPLAERRVNPRADQDMVHEHDVEAAKKTVAFAICEYTTTANGDWMVVPDGWPKNSDAARDRRATEIYEKGYGDASRLVEDHWSVIERVADSLLKKTRLTAAEVAALVKAPR